MADKKQDDRPDWVKRIEDQPPPGMGPDGELNVVDEADIPAQRKAFREAMDKGELPPGWRRVSG